MEKNKISRIENLNKYSIILCVLVVLIHDHIPHYYDYGSNHINNVLHYVMIEIIPKFTSIAVPSFFILSGFLFFRNYKLGLTLQKYKSRFYSLVIPYLIWNTIGLIFEMITRMPIFASLGQVNSNPFLPKSIFYGIFLHQYTILWFVFALILYVTIAPLIFLCIRKRCIGVLVILITIYLIQNQVFIITLPNGCYFESSSLAYYLVGSFFGLHIKEFYSKKVSFNMSILSAIFLLVIIGFECYLNNILQEWSIIKLLVKSYLFWNFCSYFFLYLRERKWFGYTFFIYVIHLNVIRAVSAIIRLLSNHISQYNGIEFLQYLFTFVFTMFISVWIANMWKKKSVYTYNIVTGNR